MGDRQRIGFHFECNFNLKHTISIQGYDVAEAIDRARFMGWVMALRDGQRNFCCPQCKRELENTFGAAFPQPKPPTETLWCLFSRDHKATFQAETLTLAMKQAREAGWFAHPCGASWQSICPDCLKQIKDFLNRENRLPIEVIGQPFADQLEDVINEGGL